MDAYMAAAIAEAEAGLAEGGIPIGSVLVHEGKIVGRGHNRRVQRGSSILHGEMDALEQAGRLPAQSLQAKCHLHDTFTVCDVLRSDPALWHSRVVIGENITFMGEEELLRSRGVILEVLQDPRCIEMMKQFITEQRDSLERRHRRVIEADSVTIRRRPGGVKIAGGRATFQAWCAGRRRRDRLEIAMRCRSKGALEHRDEGAGAVIAHFQRDRRNRPAGGEQPQGVEQPQLLPPSAKCHACFLLEESLEGPRTGSHPFRHLLDQPRIVRMCPQPRGRAFRPFIGGKGEP